MGSAMSSSSLNELCHVLRRKDPPPTLEEVRYHHLFKGASSRLVGRTIQQKNQLLPLHQALCNRALMETDDESSDIVEFLIICQLGPSQIQCSKGTLGWKLTHSYRVPTRRSLGSVPAIGPSLSSRFALPLRLSSLWISTPPLGINEQSVLERPNGNNPIPP
ncbi:expressed unknown protein [Seminavis robusta]|uniref:Uncharacterized protein n=1 Tax=Seminavis robusta TaxID=568900 RepID=A0A9N8HR71_9STRA|nr:expressed unknown protein [Seminavis robusta]|eukprot:Sro1283_g259150.1 n/a (162) ;mRNA; f:25303-25788